MVTIIRGSTNKPVSSQQLASFFANRNTKFDGFLYLGYPIIGTSEGPYPIDALFISRNLGLVVFSLIEGNDIGISQAQESQDDSYNKLEAKLRTHKILMKGRHLQVPIKPVTFAPVCHDTTKFSTIDYPVCNENDLDTWLNTCRWDDASVFESLVSVIQAISTIRRGRKKRDIKKKDSRGAKLKNLEDSIANLDNHQSRAVIETVDGVQRIRGLAGSGKTIVLALKAAYLHAQHPDWRIAVTFNTRSLKAQFRQLINTFTIEQTNEEPDWDNVQIMNAWGAPGGGERTGIYYEFCQNNGVEFYDFNSEKLTFGSGNEFIGACQAALAQCSNAKNIYDVILVDEAQDLSPAFLQICYEMLKPEKRLVYAYDELQNLGSLSLPPPEEIFGKRPDGSPKVRLTPSQPGRPQQDVILEKCYRNSRPVLVTAHALGFGIYRTPDNDTATGLVQMFDHNRLWLDVGYQVTDGKLEDGHDVVLSRTDESSPVFLEDHSSIDDLIQFHCFDSMVEQTQWVADAIRTNLTDDELRPDDILVVNPDPLTTRSVVAPVRQLLYEYGINSHLAGVDTSQDVFFDSEGKSVTFTGIFRAKGNEAGMVYILNAQDCYSSHRNLARIRNRLFTAITRSKGWVRVLGFGHGMRLLMQEFERLRNNDFNLRFQYPSEEIRKRINVINRDMRDDERRLINTQSKNVEQLIKDLEAHRVYPQDLGSAQVKRLKSLLDTEVG
ncbi:MAG: ATP-binding domain-containing protein [Magnetococcales bacterium]|nr:ATP-binding domain-containing protein [Magnetococcales bacterium]